MVRPARSVPKRELPPHPVGIACDEVGNRRLGPHPGVVAQGVDGQGEEEEVGLARVGSQQGAVEEGVLEHVFAVVVAEPGVGGVGVREEDAGEGRGGVAGVRVDEDPESPHHVLHARPQEFPVVVGAAAAIISSGPPLILPLPLLPTLLLFLPVSSSLEVAEHCRRVVLVHWPLREGEGGCHGRDGHRCCYFSFVDGHGGQRRGEAGTAAARERRGPGEEHSDGRTRQGKEQERRQQAQESAGAGKWRRRSTGTAVLPPPPAPPRPPGIPHLIDYRGLRSTILISGWGGGRLRKKDAAAAATVMACRSSPPPPSPHLPSSLLALRARWCCGRPLLSPALGMAAPEGSWRSRWSSSPSSSPLLLLRPRRRPTYGGDCFRSFVGVREVHRCSNSGRRGRKASDGTVFCYMDETGGSRARGGESPDATGSTGVQLYSQIERLITETARESQDGWNSGDWSEIEGAWVLKPKDSKPTSVVHFIGGIFVGAAPQLTYRFFLERLADKGILVIATPFASGFDHFFIADEAQFKFDRCLRSLQDTVNGLPTFGIGHSLGSVIHLLIGSRYAVQRSGNILMAFNNKEASLAIPLFSPVIVPMAQSFGPLLSQLTSSPAIRHGAEIAMKQLENLSPPIMRQVLPLVEQLPPLYTDLVKGREDFTPKPEETRRLIKSYYGVSRNLLIKFKDDTIDETPTLAQVLSSESAISLQLDMSIRTVPGDHGLPLQQVLPDVPPGVADAVNKGGEFLASLTVGTPWETMAQEMGNTFGADSRLLRAQISQDVEALADLITSWMVSDAGPRRLRP